MRLCPPQSPTGFAASASLRVNATVHGLGPLFKLKFSVVNTGARRACLQALLQLLLRV